VLLDLRALAMEVLDLDLGLLVGGDADGKFAEG
jgi:hypothetical protein